MKEKLVDIKLATLYSVNELTLQSRPKPAPVQSLRTMSPEKQAEMRKLYEKRGKKKPEKND